MRQEPHGMRATGIRRAIHDPQSVPYMRELFDTGNPAHETATARVDSVGTGPCHRISAFLPDAATAAVEASQDARAACSQVPRAMQESLPPRAPVAVRRRALCRLRLREGQGVRQIDTGRIGLRCRSTSCRRRGGHLAGAPEATQTFQRRSKQNAPQLAAGRQAAEITMSVIDESNWFSPNQPATP